MEADVRSRLLQINRDFYRELAGPFAQTRARPQPGFQRLLPYLDYSNLRLLDVGCGEGRFGRFLMEHRPVSQYVGVDFSPDLLQEAEKSVDGIFLQRDLTRPGSLVGLDLFHVVSCLAVLQHIPGRKSRIDLLREIGQHLMPDGRLLLSTWQFLDSERQRRKIRDWEVAGLMRAQVEENDFLLTWKSGGFGLRYVSYIDEAEVTALAAAAGLEIVDAFRSDGREGDLNLYAILRRQEEADGQDHSGDENDG